MGIKTDDPRYQDYERECRAVADETDAKVKEARAAQRERGFYGYDGPATAIHKEGNRKFKEIQQKYHFLFTDD